MSHDNSIFNFDFQYNIDETKDDNKEEYIHIVFKIRNIEDVEKAKKFLKDNSKIRERFERDKKINDLLVKNNILSRNNKG